MPRLKPAETTESIIRDILFGFTAEDEIGPNGTLESLGLDSLDVVEFWMLVEEKFFAGEEIVPDGDIENADVSLQQIVAYIDRRRNRDSK